MQVEQDGAGPQLLHSMPPLGVESGWGFRGTLPQRLASPLSPSRVLHGSPEVDTLPLSVRSQQLSSLTPHPATRAQLQRELGGLGSARAMTGRSHAPGGPGPRAAGTCPPVASTPAPGSSLDSGVFRCLKDLCASPRGSLRKASRPLGKVGLHGHRVLFSPGIRRGPPWWGWVGAHALTPMELGSGPHPQSMSPASPAGTPCS